MSSIVVAPASTGTPDTFTEAVTKLRGARPPKAKNHVALKGSLAATIHDCQRDGTKKIADAIGELSTHLGRKASGVAVALCAAAFDEKGNSIGSVGTVLQKLKCPSISDVAKLKNVDAFHDIFSKELAAAKIRLTPCRADTREFVALARSAEQYLK